MSRRRRSVGLLGCFFISAGSVAALAADAQGRYMVFGPGNSSCGEWIRQRADRTDFGMAGWVTGFVSAYNSLPIGKADLASGSDVEGMLSWVDNYCRSNPLEKLASAAEALITELSRRALGAPKVKN